MRLSKAAPLLATAAGVCAACWLPLPSTSTSAPERGEADGAGGGGTQGTRVVFSTSANGSDAEEEEATPPPGEAEIARMSTAERITALDGLLRADPADPARRAAAAALAGRLFRGGADLAGGEFPGARQFPPWLLADTWLAALRDPAGVPPALARCLPGQRDGKRGAALIARALGEESGDAAEKDDAGDDGVPALLAAMPAEWRAELRLARLQGLATRRPLEAMAGLPRGDVRGQNRVILAAAAEALVAEAFRALTGGRADGEEQPSPDGILVEPVTGAALDMLYARDPAETRRLVEARGDASLTKALAEVTKRADAAVAPPPAEDGRALPELLRDPSPEGQKRAWKALMFTAADDPDRAMKAWADMEDGQAKSMLRLPLSNTLSRLDPALDFRFQKDQPGLVSVPAAQKWLEADAPAAMREILSMPYGSELREKLLIALRSKEPEGATPRGWVNPHDFPGAVNRRDLILAAQELPPELLRHVTRED